MGITVGELTALIKADSSPFSKDLQELMGMGTDFTKNFGSGMQSLGKITQNIGMQITKFITIPIVGAGVAVFKLGKDFESEMAKIVGLVGISRTQVDAWSDSILKLAPSLGKAPKELAEALFFIASAGIRGAEAMDVLTMSAKASTAGLGETKTIADLVTSAINAYGSENLSASQATDILVAAVREGKAEASELAASMGQVLPLASQMGVTFDQVAATQAAMTKTGTNAAEAATQLKSILAGLIKPSKQAEEQLDAMGTSSAKMRKKIRDEGLLTALMDLRTMTNKYGEEAMARVFPNIRALMGVLDLMGSSLNSNIELFDAVKNSTGSLNKAFKSASETVDFKWNSAIGKMQSFLIGFFNVLKSALIPIFNIFIKILDFVSVKFNELSPTVQNLSGIFVVLAGLVGPAIAIIGMGITALGGAIAAATTIFTTFTAILSTIGLPVLLGIAAGIAGVIVQFTAIAAVVVATAIILGKAFLDLWNTNDKFRKNVISTWETIKEKAKLIFSEIKIIVSTILDAIRVFWNNHGSAIMNIANSIWLIVSRIVTNGMSIILNTIRVISGIMKGDWSKVWNSIKSIVSSANNIIVAVTLGMLKIMNTIMASVGRTIINSLKNAFNKITSINWKQAGYNIAVAIAKGLASGIVKISNIAGDIATTIRNKLPFSPAKEGPLKDLDKLNFAGPILKSMNKALISVETPSINLGNSILTGLGQSGINNTGMTHTGSVNFYGPMSFNGINDIYDFMNEMKTVIQKHTGRGRSIL